MWYSDDDEAGLKEIAWYNANAGGKTHAVCQKTPNAWRLYDMHGNVWEWCQDWWAVDYYEASPLADPAGPTGRSNRVFRGGSWFTAASFGRASYRYGDDVAYRHVILGFRLARSLGLPVVLPSASGEDAAQGDVRNSPLERPLGPPFQPQGRLAFLDLQPQANRRLDEPFGRLPENNLRELRPGEQELAGLRFKIGPKFLFLAGQQFREVPEKAEGITVNRAFSRLYILHAAAYADVRWEVPDGTLIAQYVLHYEDGVQETIPVVCGEDVRDWFSREDAHTLTTLTRGKVIWTGSNPAARRLQAALNLYLTVWQNPHSEKRVVALDYVSTMTTAAAPFCVAITAEEPVQGEVRPAGN